MLRTPLYSITCLLALATTSAFAATQGTLGFSSSGSLSLSVTKSSTAKISGLRDMSVAWNTASTDVTWTNDLCVYSSHAAGSYKVTAIGSARANGAFVMADGEKTLPYDVLWNAGGAGNLSNNGVALTPNSATAATKATTTSANCQGTQNAATARLIIHIPQSNLQASAVGNYADSLTLIVAPD